MKASYRWIRDYLSGYDGTAEQMADQLTFSGTEVEGIEPHKDDFILELGVTSNRGDCLCHLGLAREVAAVSGARLTLPEAALTEVGEPCGTSIQVIVEDAEACPRYTARILEGVRVGPSPAWLVERLESLGLRSVNNVVDVTNFVMFESNQPLHAFDLDRVRGGKIMVRRARAGESFTALNDKTYALDPEDLLICDGVEPVALAGVMGGKDTEVSDQTTRVLLETAHFAPSVVRRSVRRHGLTTDASYRFERRCDRANVEQASARAARLIVDIAGGSVRPSLVDVGGPGRSAEPITLRLPRIARICGIDVERTVVERIFARLQCEVADAGADALTITPPSWRSDLHREIDLIEEVIRCHGLDKLPLKNSMSVVIPHVPPEWRLRDQIKDWMVALGAVETLTPNFIQEGVPSSCAFLAEGEPVVVQNPVRSGEGVLRRSLVPSLIKVRKHNQDQGNENCRLFELSNLHFFRGKGEVPLHVPAFAALVDGDFRDARAIVDALGDHLGLSIRYVANDHPALDPRARANVVVSEQVLGVVGYPSRHLLKAYGLKVCPVAVELNVEALLALAVSVRPFEGLPKFPAAFRDLALIVSESVPFGRLEQEVRALSLPYLESLEFFDEYRGKQVGDGKKSLAIRLVFRSKDGTLTSAEVDSQIEAITLRLSESLSAQVRGA